MSTEQQTLTPAQAPVKGGLVPYLQLDGALKAASFYEKAFAAEIANAAPTDDQGRTVNVHLYVNGSSLMLADPFPERGFAQRPAQGYNLTLHVSGIDGWWTRAVDAGAEVVMPLGEMFWGARYGQLRDPFGVLWAMNEPLA